LKPFSFITILLLFAAASANAQERPAGPTPILVDVIGAATDSLPLPKPKKTRDFGRPVSSGPGYELERRIFDLLNDERAGKGISPLIWDDEVAEIARVHSQNMADHKFFSHRDLEGLTVDGRAETYGMSSWRGIGENIACMLGQDEPAAAAVKMWMQSPGHRQNILGGMWNQSAVGVAAAKDGTFYFTQVFILR
jgi:uncharacterized protein YkwD